MKISETTKEIFLKHSKAIELPKKHSLLSEGEVSKYAYFIQEGCLRMWYNNEGDDVTIKFFVPNDVVSSLESFYLELPGKFALESLVPSVVREIHKSTFDDYMSASPEFRTEMLGVSVRCMADYQNLFLNSIMNNPEDRYRLLVEENPRLFDVVPHHYIASYLGMTPVSLSRIRKRTRKD